MHLQTVYKARKRVNITRQTFSEQKLAHSLPLSKIFLLIWYFADDQVICAQDEFDAQYMLTKLVEEYEKWGLKINTQKTEYMVVGAKGNNLESKEDVIKCTDRYKYLGTAFTTTGTYEEEIKSRIGQGRQAIRTLHSVIWDKTLTKRIKRLIYKTIVEPILTYGAEVWTITEQNKKKLKAAEMDYWQN